MVHVTVSTDDDGRTDEATRRLLRALPKFSQVATVVRTTDGPAPEDARGDEVVTLGGLALTVLSQPEAIGAVLKFIAERITEHGTGRIDVEVDGQVLKVEKATPEQRDAIVDAFIRKVFGTDS